ncbi:shewanella-like protein phosphatase 1 isoform X1 [Chenopodium quinoa]|uniref:shewanella-like protein phosphatase 1 isoform X1 n=1 Tax=Chenopodium quinoa TaxID=63459 RepID=UPI000B79A6D7|nr:shewanella-like protein phosphatase 1 isoform X1 [Chenopodium quinoa]
MASLSLCLKPYKFFPIKFSLSQNFKTPENYNNIINYSNNDPINFNVKGKDLKPIIITGNPPTFVSAPDRRIVAVGDLHGDLSKARWALNMAGVLSSDGRDLWTGGETVLIQLGDILDRGEDEIAILSLLRSLDIQARVEGGAVFQVNGNHETMNIEGDYRYVDSGGFEECMDFLEYLNECNHNWDEAFIGWNAVSERRKEDRQKYQNNFDPWSLIKSCNNTHVLGQKQRGIIARSVLLQPGGRLSRELARHPIVLQVNDWVFCHGGLLPHHVGYGIERMNKEVSHWMRVEHDNDEDTTSPLPFIATRGYDSVVWNRLYSRDTSDLADYEINQIHEMLEETLRALGAKAMVVGHTPQIDGVNCEYNCSIWRVDVGMSSGVLNSRPEVLEINGDKARAIRSHGDASNELQVLSYL